MGGKPIPWVQVIKELRAQPGMWILHPAMCRRSPGTVININQRRIPRAVRLPDGRIQAKHGWIGATIDGRELADIYLRYRPHEEGAPHGKEE